MAQVKVGFIVLQQIGLTKTVKFFLRCSPRIVCAPWTALCKFSVGGYFCPKQKPQVATDLGRTAPATSQTIKARTNPHLYSQNINVR